MNAAAALERAYSAVLVARSALRWGLGGVLASWRYLRHVGDLERETETRRGPDTGPVDRPVPGGDEDLQPRAEGAGASLRRRYRVRVRDAAMSAEELIDALARDPNRASPLEVSRFVKTKGRLGEMAEGDEYTVWMPGPWNGPVRVAERGPRAFRLATLQGHMEAGEIEFRAREEGDELVVEIESAARSGSVPFLLVYGPLRVAQEMQLHMWAHFLERAAAIAGGEPAGPVQVTTIRFPDDRGEPSRRGSRRAMRMLERLQDRRLNFDPAELEGAGPETGWLVDDHSVHLATEPPGPPVPGGPWEVARDLVRDYRFADPRLIEAIYYPSQRLEERNMLLHGHFLGMRFLFGVRVAAVVDETREIDGRQARLWGWSYRTLEGHLERGQMEFEALKWLDSGEVLFRIRAISQKAPVRNPVIRWGFHVFGRGLQLRFARLALERMRDLVAAELAGRDEERRAGGAPAAVPVETTSRPDDAEGAGDAA